MGKRWDEKEFKELFQNPKDWCDKCGYELPCEDVLDEGDCGCCWEDRQYCKECFLEFLFNEYKSLEEWKEYWRKRALEKHWNEKAVEENNKLREEIKKLKGEK